MNLNNIFLVLMSFSLFGCSPKKELSTVKDVELTKYSGEWYEIARLPNTFEKNLKCVTANYSLKDNGGILVTNKGYNTKKEKWEEANGNAKIPNLEKPGEIRVSFFRPFYGDYYIIELDPMYNHVLVGSPSREYLWILSRTKELSPEIYQNYINIAQSKGFDISSLHKTVQDCDN
ncbi:MAG: lipocalin family protein [Flavobacteriales bacterium]